MSIDTAERLYARMQSNILHYAKTNTINNIGRHAARVFTDEFLPNFWRANEIYQETCKPFGRIGTLTFDQLDPLLNTLENVGDINDIINAHTAMKAYADGLNYRITTLRRRPESRLLSDPTLTDDTVTPQSIESRLEIHLLKEVTNITDMMMHIITLVVTDIDRIQHTQTEQDDNND